MQVEKIDTFSGHRGGVYALSKGEQPEVFFSGAADGMLVKWNLSKPDVGKAIAQFQRGIFAIHYVADFNQLWISTHLEGIHVIDLISLKEIFSFAETNHSIFSFEQVGHLIFAAHSGGGMHVFDVKTCKLVQSSSLNPFSIRKIIKLSDELLLVASSNGKILTINAEFQVIHEVDAHQQTVFSMAFLSNQQQLISVGKDAKVKKWDVVDGQLKMLSELVGHIFTIHDVVTQPSGDFFATSSMDKTIKIWDANEFKLVKVIDQKRHGGHKNSVNKLYWSDYQDFLVSASDDKNISVWKLNS
ncbi:MAG: hypothetical protein RI995_458 [Bacteroidota bacterium]